jgi:hypothetical protein
MVSREKTQPKIKSSYFHSKNVTHYFLVLCFNLRPKSFQQGRNSCSQRLIYIYSLIYWSVNTLLFILIPSFVILAVNGNYNTDITNVYKYIIYINITLAELSFDIFYWAS